MRLCEIDAGHVGMELEAAGSRQVLGVAEGRFSRRVFTRLVQWHE
jgi:hypothetical protein